MNTTTEYSREQSIQALRYIGNRGVIYLASPYNHPFGHIMEQRFEAALHATAYLMEQGYVVYSPIVHNHPLAKLIETTTPPDSVQAERKRRGWNYWRTFDVRMLARCNALFILQLDGWENSVGLTEETNMALQAQLPTYTLLPPYHLDSDQTSYKLAYGAPYSHSTEIPITFELTPEPQPGVYY